MRRDIAEGRLRHFNEVTEKRVESDLERFDSSRRDLTFLQLADPIFPLAGGGAKFVEVGVVAVPENSAFLQGERRFISQSRGKLRSHLWHFADLRVNAVDHFWG